MHMRRLSTAALAVSLLAAAPLAASATAPLAAPNAAPLAASATTPLAAPGAAQRPPEAPTVGSDPVAGRADPGQPITFLAGGNGTPTPALRWQRAEKGSSTFVDVTRGRTTRDVPFAGAVDAYYTLGAVRPSDYGARFRAVFTNADGTATTSAARLIGPKIKTHITLSAPASAPSGSEVTVSYTLRPDGVSFENDDTVIRITAYAGDATFCTDFLDNGSTGQCTLRLPPSSYVDVEAVYPGDRIYEPTVDRVEVVSPGS